MGFAVAFALFGFFSAIRTQSISSSADPTKTGLVEFFFRTTAFAFRLEAKFRNDPATVATRTRYRAACLKVRQSGTTTAERTNDVVLRVEFECHRDSECFEHVQLRGCRPRFPSNGESLMGAFAVGG